jgi:UDP-GlcNAc:undecaprenyl-phosphate/decaprenyl-phosphate GlcNAc-1-phosphate transferase
VSEFSVLFFILLAFIPFLSFFITKWIYSVAIKFSIVDDPALYPNRKEQKKPIALLGGFSTFFICITLMACLSLFLKFNVYNLADFLQRGLFYPFKLYWVLAGIIIIYVAGFFDDKYDLKAKYYFPVVFIGLCISVFLGELKIEAFSYPFDKFNLNIGFLPQILALFWVGLCMMATKFLDGHDGLVTTVGIISFLTIASTATFSQVNQPLIFLFALLWGFSLIGFLPFNFPNAKMYLGEGGATTIGLAIGILSILSGAKIATAASVLGWFILDILFVFAVRIYLTKSITGFLKGDNYLHWHHRLKNLGLNKIQVLSVSALVAIISSQIGLLMTTEYKSITLISQFIFILLAFIFTIRRF